MTSATGVSDLPPMEELVGRVGLPTDWVLDDRAMCDLELLLEGAMAPVTGYLDLSDYKSCLERMRLTNGSVWTIPIVLPIAAHTAYLQVAKGTDEQVVKLRDRTNALVAELTVKSVYKPDLAYEKRLMFGQDHENHPYAAYLDRNHSDCFYVGGELRAMHPIVHYDFRKYRLSPEAVRLRLTERGWTTVVGFQTRNPMHRSHYELTRQVRISSNDIRHFPIGYGRGR